MGWQGLSPSESARVEVVGPRVLGSFPTGLRATLLERGVWTSVRLALEQRDLDAALVLESIRRTEWAPVHVHVALIEAAREALGREALRELGVARTRANTMGGLLPSLLHSWVRSFRGDPASLLRIGTQIWQAAFRDAGEFVIDEVAESRAGVRVIGCAPLATSDAWRAMLEGAGEGILALAGLRASVTSSSDGVGTTRFAVDWRSAC